MTRPYQSRHYQYNGINPTICDHGTQTRTHTRMHARTHTHQILDSWSFHTLNNVVDHLDHLNRFHILKNSYSGSLFIIPRDMQLAMIITLHTKESLNTLSMHSVNTLSMDMKYSGVWSQLNNCL